MARSFTIRRPRSEEDRSQFQTDYVTLDDNNPRFTGFALFDGDPTKDEDGYYEYFEHWSPILKSVPCAGDDCPLCEDGDRPRVRAKTLWYDPETETVRIFTINSNLVKQFTELRAEGDKVKGRKFRVARLDDRGNYSLMPKTEIEKAGTVKEWLKDCPDLEAGVLNQLKRKMEQAGVQKALSDDDDDEPTKARSGSAKEPAKGKKKAAAEPEADEDPDELDEEQVTVTKIVKKNNTMEVAWGDVSLTLWGTEDVDVTDYEADDELTVSAKKDGEGDLVLSAVEKAEAGDEPATGDGELPDEIEDGTFVVTDVDAEAETLDVENDDLGLKFTLYFYDAEKYGGTEVDFEDYEEGAKITLSAIKDNEGDMVATTIPEVVKDKSSKKKTAKK